MPRFALVLTFLLAAACHKPPADVGGLSADEAAQLNNAAEMLDASPDSLAVPADGNGVADVADNEAD